MRTARVCQWSVVRWRLSISICLMLAACFQPACTIPNLEKPQCTAGRDVVKKFYSFHFGTDMGSSPENQKKREQFLTSSLISELAAAGETKRDYFTATEDFPKAFRVGECTLNSDEKVTLQVLLLWRNDDRTQQKEVNAEAVNVDGRWLINRVFN